MLLADKVCITILKGPERGCHKRMKLSNITCRVFYHLKTIGMINGFLVNSKIR